MDTLAFLFTLKAGSVVGNTLRRSGSDKATVVASDVEKNIHLYLYGCSGGVISGNTTVKKYILDGGSANNTVRPVNAYNIQSNSGMVISGNDFTGCTTGTYNRYTDNTDCRTMGNLGLDVEIPENSVSMEPLTFTGAVNATYDGSEAVSVEIPESGGGSSEPVLLVDFTAEEDVTFIAATSNDTETEFNEIRFACYLISAANENERPIYIGACGAGCWVRSASTKVDGRTARMFGRLDLRLDHAQGNIYCACPGNSAIDTNTTYNDYVMYGEDFTKNMTTFTAQPQGGQNIMKAGSWIKVWGLK